MTNPLDLEFPAQMVVTLTDSQREALEHLANTVPHESDDSLLNEVVSSGLVAMLERSRLSARDVSQSMNAAKARIRALRSENGEEPSSSPALKASLAFPARLTVDWDSKHDLDQIHAGEAERDKEEARMRRELGLAMSADDGGVPGFRPVENYIGVPLQDGLRRGLESVLNANPGLEEENLFAALLGLGLKKVQEDPKVLAPLKGAQVARMPLGTKVASGRQRFKAEWRALCNMVANGYR